MQMVAARALGAAVCDVPFQRPTRWVGKFLQVTPGPGFPERYKLFTNEVKRAVAARAVSDSDFDIPALLKRGPSSYARIWGPFH